MSIGDRIAAQREALGLSQTELAKAVGISQPAIAYYENDERDPKASVLQKIAEVLGVSISYLLGVEDAKWLQHPGELRRAPIVGRIAAGDPREAIEQADSWQYVFNPNASDDSFYLVCAGDSMNKVIPQDMLVLIDPDKETNSGDVAAVMVNGDDATLKRVYFAGDTIVLHPESTNGSYRDRTIDKTNPDAPEFRVIGPVIALCTPPGWKA